MTGRVPVGPVDEFPPGERTLVTVEGREVGVFNVDGELYAIANRCAHEGGPVCDGQPRGALVGEYVGPGERVRESFSTAPAIACPWHGWEYDLRTGRHLGDPSIAIPTYDVVVVDGVVHVEP